MSTVGLVGSCGTKHALDPVDDAESSSSPAAKVAKLDDTQCVTAAAAAATPVAAVTVDGQWCIICKKQAQLPIRLPCDNLDVACAKCVQTKASEQSYFLQHEHDRGGGSPTYFLYNNYHCPCCRADGSTVWIKALCKVVLLDLSNCTDVAWDAGRHDHCHNCHVHLEEPILKHLQKCTKFDVCCPKEFCGKWFKANAKHEGCDKTNSALDHHAKTECTGFILEDMGLTGLPFQAWSAILAARDRQREATLKEATTQAKAVVSLFETSSEHQLNHDQSMWVGKVMNLLVRSLTEEITKSKYQEKTDPPDAKLVEQVRQMRCAVGLPADIPTEEKSNCGELEYTNRAKLFKRAVEVAKHPRRYS